LNLTESIRHIIKQLKPVYSEQEGGAIARLLIEHFGYNLSPVARLEPHILSEEEKLQIDFWVNELLNNKPVQYVLGYGWFMDRKIFVNEHCLIPRQETEELVVEILKDTKKNFHSNILDIGTGSGCIALSLAKELNDAKIYASDISNHALQIAQKNSNIYKAEITFIEDNILLPDYSKFPSFNIIVSNPPYVREQEKKNMLANVLDFEPSLALFVSDNDPLLYYKAIINFSVIKLIKSGKLYFEINEIYGKEITQLLKEHGFNNVVLIKDIHGKDRIIKALKL